MKNFTIIIIIYILSGMFLGGLFNIYQSNKNYIYFISYDYVNDYSNGTGNIKNFSLSQKITSNNINESINIIKKFLENEEEVENAIITNFILLK